MPHLRRRDVRHVFSRRRVYFAAFVLLVSAPKALLLFGLIDLLAAIWTWLALKKDAAR
jgi:hypothetical protein